MEGAPKLETERLILRASTRRDFDAYAAMWAEEAVWRFTTGAPVEREAAWRRFLAQTGHWALMDFGYWAVAEKSAPDVYVGEVGFADFRRELTPSLGGAPDTGWALAPAVHGRGYAKEAAIAAHAWWDARFPGRRTTAIIAPRNAPSIKLAGALGYTAFAETRYGGSPVALFERAPRQG